MNVAVIDVVIVNWNSGNSLERCLCSIKNYGADLLRQIIVVDNGSTDGSEGVCSKYDHVTLIRVGTNLGFAKACNIGAKNVSSDWILFLNPDTALLPNSISNLSKGLELVSANVGICGVQLVNEAGAVARTCVRFPTASQFFLHTVGLDRFWPRLGYPMLDWDHATTCNVDQIMGAFYLVRLHIFEELKGFDERFFVYMDDLDFSYRAMKMGWQSKYISEIQVFHEGGGCSKNVKASRLFYLLRSRMQFTLKYFRKPMALLQVSAIIGIEPWTRFAGALLSSHATTNVKELFQAYLRLLIWIRNEWMIKK